MDILKIQNSFKSIMAKLQQDRNFANKEIQSFIHDENFNQKSYEFGIRVGQYETNRDVREWLKEATKNII